MQRIAVKLAYEGKDFAGSQRQPGLPTVEGEVIRSLRSIGAIGSVREARFASASRTDRGVSALGNVVAFDTDFPYQELIQALNGVSDTVHFHAIALVAGGFSPRRARGRWYRYFLPSGVDTDALREVAEVLVGRHDFAGFSKPDGRDTVKRLDRVDISPVADFLAVDFHAREFLRNMVRRLVAAMEEVGRGRATVDDVRDVLEGGRRPFGLAPPEYLVLMDVSYDVEFQTVCPPSLERKVIKGERNAFLRLTLFREMRDLCSPRDR